MKPSSYVFLCVCLFFAAAGGLSAADPFRIEDKEETKQLILTEGTMPILTYQYGNVEHNGVPQDDPRRIAGCYVHPLHGINGEILTDNAPKDHYHQHGVFWTWPRVNVHEPDGKITKYDLWTSNTALKQHFVQWIEQSRIHEASASFAAENGWFIGNPKDGNKIMTEQVRITVSRISLEDGKSSRTVDFEFEWQPVGKPVSLEGSEGKSYGGFSVRLKPHIEKGEAKRSEINTITVPSGIADGDLPETRLAWADYTSIFEPEKRLSGAAVFVPKNYPDYPPTWLTRYYGLLAVGWPGTKERIFQPGEKIQLRSRIWIHEGNAAAEQINKAYEMYE